MLLDLSILTRRPHWPHLKRSETRPARPLDAGRGKEAASRWGVDTEVGPGPVRRLRRNFRKPLVRSDWLRVARVGLSRGVVGGSRCPLVRRHFTQAGRRTVRGGSGWKPYDHPGGMEAAGEPGNLAGVRHIILVLSGKGGVGKSTISTELALALRHAGKKVQGKAVHQCDSGWVPVFVDQEQSISLMSVGFLLEKPDEAVVWRGPKKNALIKQFVSDVAWGQLDYLVVDTPPGTSDEHMAVVDTLRPYSPLGALVVTTPQAVSVGDVRRELTFCKKVGLRVIGVVENMSGFVCPHCAECTNVFSRGGGEELARHAGVPFLGSVPLDPELTRSLEEGRDFIRGFPESPAFPALSCIAQKILNEAPVGLS
ncbi:cytosolic Fe-S cluster assembly factor NUBP2 isoform X2 [Lagenorhynchus albirostris]|uniref:cytosolic Fe-S cluster assembly factor NUBP2 isoform X2 n=2 Tax=Delphinidae TaxID=9726 RepID=UPI0028EFC6CE|nr:cytosolic Fe-S cluster assembly factor NUBP2 isoform X2 [Lagenorhynchus albirostris]